MTTEKLYKETFNLIIKQAKKSETNVFNKPTKLMGVANVGVFDVNGKKIKIVLYKDGVIKFRHYDSNKFKGFTITPRMSDDEVDEIFEFFSK